MKEKLSEQLRSAIGTTSMSEQSWNAYLDNVVIPFLPKDETEHSEYLAKHTNYLKSQTGQYNKDIATYVNEFKKNYKPEEVIIQPQLTPPDLKDENAVKLQEISERLAKMETAKEAEKKSALHKANLVDAKAKLIATGASDEAILEIALKLIPFNGDETIEDIIAKGQAEYNKQYTSLRGDGYSPSNSNGSSGGDFKAYVERKKKEGKLP